MARRLPFALAVAALLCSSAGGASGEDSAPLVRGRARTQADAAEEALTQLPWGPFVLRANLNATGPCALTQVYPMQDDVLTVDTRGKVICLSLRDLEPRWIISLRHPLAAKPAEGPLHYVFLLTDGRGASWLQWVAKRTGVEGDASPTRLPYPVSAGVSATASTAYIGSLGSPTNNKTVESVSLVDGSLGWGYRTLGRVVATPQVDPRGDTLLVASEDKTITALPASPAGTAPARPNWEARVYGAVKRAPVVTKDWAFVVADDYMLRGFDINSGEVKWKAGIELFADGGPWLLGRDVRKEVDVGGAEGAQKAKVDQFEGIVFVHNGEGLWAFDATTGDLLFKDASAEKPVARVGDWLVTLDRSRNAQLRKGKGWPVVRTLSMQDLDFVPVIASDDVLVAATGDGTLFLAVPKR